MSEREGPPHGQFSPDGQWWWDGLRWLPASQARPRRRVWPWVVTGGVLVLIVAVVAAGALIMSRLNAGRASSSPSIPTSTADRPTTGPTATPTPTPTAPGAPVPCAERSFEGCLPGVTIGGLTAKLEDRNLRCEKDGKYRVRCSGRLENGNLVSVNLSRASGDDDLVTEINANGSALAEGPNPRSQSKQAVESTLTVLPVTLKIALPRAPATQKKIVAWSKKTLGSCPADLSTFTPIDGYELQCMNPDPPIAVGDKGRVVTTWTGGVSIRAEDFLDR